MAAKLQVVLAIGTTGLNKLHQADGKVQRFAKNTQAAFTKLASLPNLIAGAAIVGIGKSFLDAELRMEALTARMNAAVGPFGDAAEEMQRARMEAQRVGVSFEKTAHSYSGFAAAALRSNISLKDTREIFKNISETAVSMQLSGAKTELVFMALEQMASKGVVSMEELRRQLAESLPGAVQIGARAMGMTTSAFMELVSKGEVLADEFLPKFARQVREELGGSFDEMANKTKANTERMRNSWFLFRAELGSRFIPDINKALTSMVDGSERVTENMKNFEVTIRSVMAVASTFWNSLQFSVDLVVGTVSYLVIIAKNAFDILWRISEAAFGLIFAIDKAKKMALKGNFKGAADEVKKAWGEAGTSIKGIGKEIEDVLYGFKGTAQIINESWDKNAGQMVDSWVKIEQAANRTKAATATALGSMAGDSPTAGGKKGKSALELYREREKARGKPVSFGINPMAGEAQAQAAWAARELMALEFHQSLRSFAVETASQEAILAENMKTVWSRAYAQREGLARTMFTTIVALEGTAQEKLKSIMAAAYNFAANLLFDFGKTFIKHKIAETQVSIVQEKKKQMENVKTAATQTAGAAAASAESAGKIPYVGWLLAAGAALAISALLYSQISKAKSFERGTPFAPGGMSLVGERGPEVTNIPQGSQVFTAGQTSRMMQQGFGSGGQQTHHWHINDSVTGDRLVNALNSGRLDSFVEDFTKRQRRIGV